MERNGINQPEAIKLECRAVTNKLWGYLAQCSLLLRFFLFLSTRLCLATETVESGIEKKNTLLCTKCTRTIYYTANIDIDMVYAFRKMTRWYQSKKISDNKANISLLFQNISYVVRQQNDIIMIWNKIWLTHRTENLRKYDRMRKLFLKSFLAMCKIWNLTRIAWPRQCKISYSRLKYTKLLKYFNNTLFVTSHTRCCKNWWPNIGPTKKKPINIKLSDFRITL